MQDNPKTLQSISQTMPQIGRLESIIVRPARGLAAIERTSTSAIVGVGLNSDLTANKLMPEMTKFLLNSVASNCDKRMIFAIT